MTKLVRWDTGETIREGDGTIAELVEACGKLGISAFRANLRSANLESANLESANLESANLESANLYGANLYGANLESANLRSANLRSANLPIYCRWSVSYSLAPDLIVHIGCKSNSVSDWDAWFAGSDEFDTPRSDERFVRIRANYLAMRAYLIALGLHAEAP